MQYSAVQCSTLHCRLQWADMTVLWLLVFMGRGGTARPEKLILGYRILSLGKLILGYRKHCIANIFLLQPGIAADVTQCHDSKVLESSRSQCTR